MTSIDKKITLFDYLNSINYDKQDIMDDETQKEYVPFLINRFLSAQIDTVLYANEVNQRPFLSPRMQYDYLRHSIRSKRRFCKWMKKEKIEKVELLKNFFEYNQLRAEEIADIISDEQLIEIKASMDTGGQYVP